jgi:superkiller protein 3
MLSGTHCSKPSGEENMTSDHAARLNQEGLAYFRDENFTLARDRFAEAAKANPTEAEYPNNMGSCELQMGNAAEAERLYRKAKELKPENDLYSFNLGLALLQQGKSDDAIKQFDNATRLNSKNQSAWAHLGVVQYTMGKKKEAEASLRKALELGPEPEAANNLGMVLMEQGKLDEAETLFKGAAMQAASYSLPLFNLGVLYQQKRNQPEQSVQYYLQAVERDPTYAPAHMNLGIVQKKLGQKESARYHLEQFVKVAPAGMERQVEDARRMLAELR